VGWSFASEAAVVAATVVAAGDGGGGGRGGGCIGEGVGEGRGSWWLWQCFGLLCVGRGSRLCRGGIWFRR
jgi:hypothetical protein